MSRVDPSATPRRGLRGAWWILLAVGLFFVAVLIAQLAEVRRSRGVTRVGDGRDPATYGFALDTLELPRHLLAAAMPRDTLEPLRPDRLMTPAAVDSLNRAERGKYLVSEDEVIGVTVGGVSRAYALRVLAWHEVALDTLGGVPVAVCWHPLSGAAVVLDRRAPDGVVNLGLSGLVWNSHHLLYDPADLSLWLPLRARGVAGPAAGDTLAVIPSSLVTWGRWRQAHPRTTTVFPHPDMRAAYKRDPYGNYNSGDVLRYPVGDLPPLAEGEQLKDRLDVDATVVDGVPAARLHGFRFVLDALGLR